MARGGGRGRRLYTVLLHGNLHRVTDCHHQPLIGLNFHRETGGEPGDASVARGGGRGVYRVN